MNELNESSAVKKLIVMFICVCVCTRTVELSAITSACNHYYVLSKHEENYIIFPSVEL